MRSSPAGAVAASSTAFGAAAAMAVVAALGSSLRRRRPKQRSMRRVVVGLGEDRPELMTDEIYEGELDPETNRKNYVNPWEERVEGDEEKTAEEFSGEGRVPTGMKFHPYNGPVYKQVPVVEGLEFPLDNTLYKSPLVPPNPGAKWGDGRSEDGNWYMEVEEDGGTVQNQYWQGWGRRKTACAIVRILKGRGQFIINGREATEYFNGMSLWWLKAAEPLAAMNEKNNYDILAKAFGGGLSGQAGAIRLGLARAMVELNYNWRPLLKKAKYLTRDWRTVESKKTGRPKARKKTPYHKR